MRVRRRRRIAGGGGASRGRPQHPVGEGPAGADRGEETREDRKATDGGVLTDIECEPIPSDFDESTAWECRCMRSEGTEPFPAVYRIQMRSDGTVNNFTLRSPR